MSINNSYLAALSTAYEKNNMLCDLICFNISLRISNQPFFLARDICTHIKTLGDFTRYRSEVNKSKKNNKMLLRANTESEFFKIFDNLKRRLNEKKLLHL